MLTLPIAGWLLNQWGAIAVERQGRDSASVRTLLTALRAGKVLAVAAEGRRTRTGRLQPINPVLARISASVDVPLVPVGNQWFVRGAAARGGCGRARASSWCGWASRFDWRAGPSATDGARRIRAEIAALLPPAQQPLDDDTRTYDDDDLND